MSNKRTRYSEINSLKDLGANTAKLARKSVTGFALSPLYVGYGLIYLGTKKRKR